MNTPTDLFSFGLFRLEQALNTLDKDGVFTFATYNWDRNEINISISRFKLPGGIEACKELIDDVRSTGGVFPNSGKPYSTTSTYGQLFGSLGSENKSKPKGVEKTIDDSILISARTGIGESMTECEGKLLSNSVTVKRTVLPDKPKN